MILQLLVIAFPVLASEYDPNQPENLNSTQLSAQSAIVIDAKSCEAVFEKNADDRRYPASTTKVLTALLAITLSKPDEMVTVNASALMIPEDSSIIGLVEGEQLRMDDLIKATMVFSGNDGANAISEHIAGSQEAFANIMNENAYRLGAVNTHFVNSHGYHDDNHYSTARDMAIITRAAMENETFREIAELTTYTLEANQWRERKRKTSDNDFLMNPSREEGQFYYPYAIGIKTGYHSLAGRCFVGAAKKDGIELISVTLQGSSRGRWTDTKKLMEYGFSQYVTTSIEKIYQQNPKTVDISNYALDDSKLGQLELSLRKIEPLANDRLIGYKGQSENWMRTFNSRTNISFDRILEAPITAGEVVGTLIYTPEGIDQEPVQYELLANRSILKRPSIAPSLDEIKMYTQNDPNPFPRISVEFILLVLAPVLSVIILSQLFYKFFTRNKKPKFKKNTTYKTRYYR